MTGLSFNWADEVIDDERQARREGLRRLIDFYAKSSAKYAFGCHACGHETNNNSEAVALNSPELLMVKCIKCKRLTLWDLSTGLPVDIHDKKSTLHFYCVCRV